MWLSINPGAPLGGSISQYFPGFFNSTHFTAVDDAARIADFGKDNYAGQFFYGIPGDQKQVRMDWASNWQYCQNLPTADEGWRSTMSLPRYNYLTNASMIGYDLVSSPYKIDSIFASPLASNSSFGNGTLLIDYSGVPSGAVYLNATVSGLRSTTATSGQLNFTFSSSISGEFVRGGSNVGLATYVSRGHTYAFDNDFFTDKFSQNIPFDEKLGYWQLEVVIDRSIIEVFVNGGRLSATNIFFPNAPLDTLRFAVANINPAAAVSVDVWALKDAWADQAINGTVYGNTTTSLGSYRLL